MSELAHSRGGKAKIQAFVALIRPKQWIKNLFVFVPLVFAKELFEFEPVVTSLMAFLAFCLAASAVYVINDMADVESDRAHPEKKNRPIAAGSVTFAEAYVLIGVLLVCSGAILYGM
ncbi:decaprenyl-phosphate phosphoribosyltransferase, partial [Sphingobacteriales bacterium CHB3]|nr:decaprenyl-phosphate phosphoribosyltransferase [Sphingobacteriales bacterium CHB3]